MEKRFIKTSILLAGLALASVACTKNKIDQTPDDSQEQITTSSDESEVNSALDKIVEDANTLLSGSSMAGGRSDGLICGATIDSTLKSQGIFKLLFDGNTACIYGRRFRSGSITIKLSGAEKWSDAGAVLSITLENYKVTRISDNKSLTFNGTKSITNVNGGLVRKLSDGGASVVHKVRGNLSITFDDGTQRAWQVARKRTIKLASSVYTVAIEGDTTILGQSNIDVWGLNRKGNSFYGAISEPIVLSSACEYHAISGAKQHKRLTREISVVFGVDASGKKVTAPECPYGFSVTWTNIKGNTRTEIVAYK